MVQRKTAKIYLTALAIVVVTSSSAAAAGFYEGEDAGGMCPSDSWGGRTSSLTGGQNLSVTISTTTNVVHFADHPYCHGDFFARALLNNSTCAPTTSTRHHTTLPGGGDSYALAQKVCGSLTPGVRYRTKGTHGGFQTLDYSTESDEYFFPEPPDNDGDGHTTDDDCDDSNDTVWNDCTDNDGDGHYWNGDCNDEDPEWWEYCEYNPDPGSPILINLDGTGIRLTSPEDGVDFDLRPGGGVERRSWTERDSYDAWLALDRNGNGTVDDGTELFGEFTLQPESEEPNGFLALAVFDDTAEGGNGDGVIDAKDAAFSRLRLWVDRNHDGISQPGELLTLSDGGVTGLELAYKPSYRQDRWGNVFRYRAKVRTVRDSEFSPRHAVDVFLVSRVAKPRHH